MYFGKYRINYFGSILNFGAFAQRLYQRLSILITIIIFIDNDKIIVFFDNDFFNKGYNYNRTDYRNYWRF